MAISGLIGAGAQDALADLLQRQMVEQQLAERTRQFDEESSRRDAELEQQRVRDAAVADRFKRDDDRADAAMKAQADQAAYDQTADANMSELVNDPVQFKAFGAASGRLKPIDLLNINLREQEAANRPTPESPEQKSQRELSEYEGKKKLDLKYRPPTSGGGAPEQQWFMRNGQVTPIAKGTAQPGDAPYEKAAGGGKGDAQDERIKKYTQDKLAESLETVKQLKGLAGASSTGAMNLTKYLPNTPARSLENVLNQLRGQLAFKELAAMRAASPTGGGLGSITERELELLASSQGGLDPMASNFASELDKIEKSLTRAQGGVVPSAGVGLDAAMPQQKPIPGVPGGVAESLDGGKTWKRVK